MASNIYIGTSGWHYNDWIGLFYPEKLKGYNELKYYAGHFSTVENNSSFYRIAGEKTYQTWYRSTPPQFRFSLKLNREITHLNRLVLNPKVQELVTYILDTTQVLAEKLGAIVIQLPASFRADAGKLERFLDYFTVQISARDYKPDTAIEFRNAYWFTEEVFTVLSKYNVSLVAAQSSKYPGFRRVTADTLYIRMHGPDKLFASSYTGGQLEEWADWIIRESHKVRRVYVYFNNDFYGYAIANAKQLIEILRKKYELPI